MSVLGFVAVWFVVSVPLGIIVGKLLKSRAPAIDSFEGYDPVDYVYFVDAHCREEFLDESDLVPGVQPAYVARSTQQRTAPKQLTR